VKVTFSRSSRCSQPDRRSCFSRINLNKGSVFGYASELSYDKDERGVTFGLVGWTSKQDGPGLFQKYLLVLKEWRPRTRIPADPIPFCHVLTASRCMEAYVCTYAV